jgi:hypothetical protein
MTRHTTILIATVVLATLASTSFAQSLVAVTQRGGIGGIGAWALTDNGDYFIKNENQDEHIWEHWGNVFEVAGVDPAGRVFVGMATWGGGNQGLVAICSNGDAFVRDQSTEPGADWSYVDNLFVESGHGSPEESPITWVAEYADSYVQVICANGDWYKTFGDPVNQGYWEYAGNILEMAGYAPIAAARTSIGEVKGLFR